LDGVLAVHEFHVWSLAGNKIVASLHLHLRGLDDYIRVSNEVKEYFHDEGIHSVTIQPEILDVSTTRLQPYLLGNNHPPSVAAMPLPEKSCPTLATTLPR